MSILRESTGGGTGEQSAESIGDERLDAESRGGGEDELSLDIVFGLLSNERRRQTLHYLDANDGEAGISELAEYIAALENDKPVESVGSKERKRVYVGLYQSHLPKMDEADVVTFERERGTIAWSDNADVLNGYLDSNERSISWAQYYLGLSVAGLLLVGATIALNGIEPASLQTAGLAGVLVTIALVQFYVERNR